MANKSTNVYIRIEPDVKSQAERILADLGLPASTAINLFNSLTNLLVLFLANQLSRRIGDTSLW